MKLVFLKSNALLLLLSATLTASDTWLIHSDTINNDELDELEVAEEIPSLTEEQKKKSLQA